MIFKYYGVRGSIPTPGKSTIKYGGNTSCILFESKGNYLIFDAGSGMRLLGMDLMKKKFSENGKEAAIFFSHVHWDHIQGFPFFAPSYNKNNSFVLYGTHNVDDSLELILSKQQETPNFPVRLNQLPSKIIFSFINENEVIHWHNFKIYNKKLIHPNDVFGYRIEADGHSVVYATDTEHQKTINKKLVKLAKNADILIYDCMYTPEEYKSHVGWGHSTYEAGIEIAKASNVKQFHLFHHEPMHDDKTLESILVSAKKLFPESYLAKEGWEIDLSKQFKKK